jgi:hypothetical protein
MNRRAPMLALCLVAAPLFAGDPEPNTLTASERAEGWQLLFDGRTFAGWRGFKRDAFPDRGWIVQDGVLLHLHRGGGGDIVTERLFNDYELRFEWKVAPGGNSGVKYFITEERSEAIGHEYQLLSPRSRAEALRDLKHATASFYDVLPPSTNALPRSGEWNEARIVVQGKRVEHWLNGERVLVYELGSPRVAEGIASSKFKDVSGFGTKFRHHILLQDHGGEAAFRNIKIRELPGAGS